MSAMGTRATTANHTTLPLHVEADDVEEGEVDMNLNSARRVFVAIAGIRSEIREGC